ncbi:YiiX/YebB-like N1pC/P60 family cysteine hydrolase [Peribacillus frigoritolerans]|uniref:YiiX/YebB-like N1pC/P60 family cysteine hydrolase n=1 Tax=Peribacillus frigoritolerans TaxID=450367 RepID=UPI003D358C71
MLKMFFATLCITTILLGSTISAQAADTETVQPSQKEIEKMLDDAKKETEFAKKNWNKIAKEKIEEGKKEGNRKKSDSTLSTMATGTANFTTGDLLVTMDSTYGSAGFRYGHAAIVYTSNEYTIESYDTTGVKKFAMTKWKPGGKIDTMIALWVKGATSTDYGQAKSYSGSQIGDPYNYSFWDSDRSDKFYCSQLLWKAWKYAGFNVNGGWDTLISPYDIVQDSDTTGYYTR